MTRLYIRCPKCKDKAFEIDHIPEIGELVVAKGLTRLDGTKPKDGDPVVCGSCNWHFCVPGGVIPTNIIEEPSDA